MKRHGLERQVDALMAKIIRMENEDRPEAEHVPLRKSASQYDKRSKTDEANRDAFVARKRQSITQATTNALIARDGGECRYPGCDMGRLVEQMDNGNWRITGEIAHIRAVRPTGAPVRPGLSRGQRQCQPNADVSNPPQADRQRRHSGRLLGGTAGELDQRLQIGHPV